MPNCEKCGRKWPWKTIAWQTIKFKNHGICPHCGAIQYMVPKSTKLTRVIGYMPAFLIILLALVLDLDGLGIILLAALLMSVFFAIYPFLTKLSTKDHFKNL